MSYNQDMTILLGDCRYVMRISDRVTGKVVPARVIFCLVGLLDRTFCWEVVRQTIEEVCNDIEGDPAFLQKDAKSKVADSETSAVSTWRTPSRKWQILKVSIYSYGV
jgi:hypothetical protein